MSTPSPWEGFSMEELQCPCCKQMNMKASFMNKLVEVRKFCKEKYGFTLPVTSGYRCPKHNAEVSHTGSNGPHTTGKAADIRIDRTNAYHFLYAALKFGMTGIGLNQKGSGRFIHVDTLNVSETSGPRPTIWTY